MTHSILILLVAALITWALRALPFALFARRNLPRVIVYLGHALPPAIMAVLVVYCLKSVDLTAFPFGLSELLGVAVTAALHLWRGNPLLSIAAGTAVYMVMIRVL